MGAWIDNHVDTKLQINKKASALAEPPRSRPGVWGRRQEGLRKRSRNASFDAEANGNPQACFAGTLLFRSRPGLSAERPLPTALQHQAFCGSDLDRVGAIGIWRL